MQHVSLLTEFDIHLFRAGKHYRIYEKLGSHILEADGVKGTYFAVWAPTARAVSVIGNFNHWRIKDNPMVPRWDGSGIWECFIPGVGKGDVYKYCISALDGRVLEKGDPYAMLWECPPRTASVVWDLDYSWKDESWMKKRKENAGKPQPYSVYEVHLGSWKKLPEDGNRSLSYVEMADHLVSYVKEMGFSHVELLPVMEHPFYGSWGYQITGYFAPSSRYGSPQEFMYLIDRFHQEGIGVILDWVPSHFTTDAHGLGDFDGTHLYEHADPRKGYHPDWQSYIFNYGRHEVRSFLISNALFWLELYHADGLRVDAVASMLYLDYSRQEGQWIPNEYGGKENLDAISLLREFNAAVYFEHPDTVTIAEESTAWSGVSRPVYEGGLGFGQKWMMGWMHDTLRYLGRETIFRRFHQDDITFSIIYAFSENFMLPLSHDEVVHGKGSLINKMPGDEWQRFANLRILFGYLYTHPGSKLLFMGGEFAQSMEWNHDRGLDWWLTKFSYHSGVQNLVKDINHVYKNHPALYHHAFSPEGFEWVDLKDHKNSVLVYLRKGTETDTPVLVVCNFSPNTLDEYMIGAPVAGTWKEILNTDDTRYGGSGVLNTGDLETQLMDYHGHEQILAIKLAPLAVMIFALKKAAKPKKATATKTGAATKTDKAAPKTKTAPAKKETAAIKTTKTTKKK